MSNTSRKIVKITESALVDLIDNIVKEAVDKKKVEWIAEQEAKKASLLESKIAKLEKTIAEITKSGK
jgi:hypothetical protein